MFAVAVEAFIISFSVFREKTGERERLG